LKLSRNWVFTVDLPASPAPDYVDDDSDTLVDGYGALEMLIGTEEAKSLLKSSEEVDGPSILLAEDNSELRQLIADRLNDDFRIIEAKNGIEALAIVKDLRPDLVLMDVLMPQMSGLEVCASLKQNSDFADIPVILISAKATEQARLEGFDAGADDYLEKPFNMAEMKIRIGNLIESRRRLRSRYQSSIRVLPEQGRLKDSHKELVQSLVRAVETELSDPSFNEHSLAQKLGISIDQLEIRTDDFFGKSAIEFISHLRMEKAAEILTKNRAAISDIANQLGYSSANEFSSAFKRRFGQSPSEFTEADPEA